MAFRFVHAADIHLDSPLRSLALRDPELAELIGTATRRALERIVDLCLAEQVDALLLAGDLYDGDQTSMKTARFLAEQMRRLDEAGIDVFLVRGNHDALSRITKELVLPERVKLFGGRAEAIPVARPGAAFDVVIHGLSFAQPHAPESLLPKYRPPLDGAVNIGLLHTSLGGAPGHDLYAPCSLADLAASGMRYWALGHIHARTVVEGATTIVMPGMPQGRDINEAGPKSVSLVTIADDRSITVEERLIALAQFERVEVDATGLNDWEGLVAALSGALEQARAKAVSAHLVARVRIVGTSPLAWRMRRDRDLLKTQADERASLLGGSRVESLELASTAPLAGAAPDAPEAPLAGDPVGELRRLIRDEVALSPGYRAEVKRMAEEVFAQLPPDLRNLFGSDEASFDAALADAVREGTDDVIALLQVQDRTQDRTGGDA